MGFFDLPGRAFDVALIFAIGGFPMKNGNRLNAVFASFGMAVFSRDVPGTFVPDGQLPLWWKQLCRDTDRFRPGDQWPYLMNFLEDAERFWSSGAAERISSGAWQETLPDGAIIHLEAHALRDQNAALLVLENLDSLARVAGAKRCKSAERPTCVPWNSWPNAISCNCN